MLQKHLMSEFSRFSICICVCMLHQRSNIVPELCAALLFSLKDLLWDNFLSVFIDLLHFCLWLPLPFYVVYYYWNNLLLMGILLLTKDSNSLLCTWVFALSVLSYKIKSAICRLKVSILKILQILTDNLPPKRSTSIYTP